eukprot:6204164-Lingulodinium_polyedra.AAC.1
MPGKRPGHRICARHSRNPPFAPRGVFQAGYPGPSRVLSGPRRHHLEFNARTVGSHCRDIRV